MRSSRAAMAKPRVRGSTAPVSGAEVGRGSAIDSSGIDQHFACGIMYSKERPEVDTCITIILQLEAPRD